MKKISLAFLLIVTLSLGCGQEEPQQSNLPAEEPQESDFRKAVIAAMEKCGCKVPSIGGCQLIQKNSMKEISTCTPYELLLTKEWINQTDSTIVPTSELWERFEKIEKCE